MKKWDGEPSEFLHEQEGLDHIRALLEASGLPFYARQCFTFTAANGKVRECDLLIAVPSGFYLLELKAHPGHVTNEGDRWRFDRRRTLHNPLHLTELKAKELKGNLKKVSGGEPVPFLKAAVFLSAADLRSDLDEFQRKNVYGREGLRGDSGLPEIMSDLIDQTPNPRHRTPNAFLERLPELLRRIGVSRIRKERKVGAYVLDSRSLRTGDTWTDYLARNPALTADEPRRVRVYSVELGADNVTRDGMVRAARREYQILAGIDHPGIVRAESYDYAEGLGPAVIFQHGKAWQTVDQYVANAGLHLPVESRLGLIRQLADALRHAHGSHLYHRGLSAGSVWIDVDRDGEPHARIADWQVASQRQTGRQTPITDWREVAGHIGPAASPYLAPEAANPNADPAQVDVFGLGALSYLILTGRPPAGTRDELVARLRSDHALVPSATDDEITPGMDQLVRNATKHITERFADIAEFSKALDDLEAEIAAQYAPVERDPLTAAPGDKVGRYTVKYMIGSGSTAKALLVKDPESERELVLKVAKDQESAAERLKAEAVTLEMCRSVHVVEFIEGPVEIGGRSVLVMKPAGEESLGDYLRRQGRATAEELQGWSEDLFRILYDLDELGIWHRDIKPDNLGVQRREAAKKRRRLVLFDFSLASVKDSDLKAGTRAYLDPFLGGPRRTRYDEYAERFAACVTLYELATGRLPSWGDGLTDPAEGPDDLPQLHVDSFEPTLRKGLTAFFERAFHRDARKRFKNLESMTEAFADIFRDEARNARASRPEITTDITPDLPLVATELSDRALTAAQERLNLSTVGDLVGYPAAEILEQAGFGTKVRNELLSRAAKWRVILGLAESTTSSGDERSRENATVDRIAELLVQTKKDGVEPRSVRLLLGLPDGDRPAIPVWTPIDKIALLTNERITKLESTLDLVRTGRWKQRTPELTSLRKLVADVLDCRGRIMDAEQLAAAVLGIRASDYDDPELRLAAAGAVVYAAAQVESAVDKPRFRFHRVTDGPVLITLTGLDDPDAPSDGDMFDYARDLGVRAARLVEVGDEDPLPDAEECVRVLREVPAPAGLTLSGPDLVRLAAGATSAAAVSRRLELYPTDLKPERVVVLTQLGSYLDSRQGIPWRRLLERVRARFGELSGFPKDYPGLLQVLNNCGIEVEAVEEGSEAIRLVEDQRTLAASVRYRTTETRGEAYDLERAARELEAAAELGGFRALKVGLKDARQAADWLGALPGVVDVDVQEVFLRHLRKYVEERGGKPSWETVLKADTARPPAAFVKLLDEVWRRVGAELREVAGAKVLALRNATPLARYAGGRKLLHELIRASRQPKMEPWALWVLCPGQIIWDSATLDGYELRPQKASNEELMLVAR